ncbi:MAG: 30S ribosomal protein S3ae [Candidatus Bathyarchaeota archaeon]
MSSSKVRDKWRLKTWCTVYAPKYFGGHEIALIPVTNPENAIGRVVEVTLYDLTKKDFSHMNIKIYFQVVKVDGLRLETVFKGHEYSREYLRSLVRRGSSKIEGIFDVETKDRWKIRVYGLAFSKRRLLPSKERSIRKIMGEVILEKSKNLTYEQFVQEAVLGKIASDIYNHAVKIAPLRHVGIMKTKLLTRPLEILQEVPSQPSS